MGTKICFPTLLARLATILLQFSPHSVTVIAKCRNIPMTVNQTGANALVFSGRPCHKLLETVYTPLFRSVLPSISERAAPETPTVLYHVPPTTDYGLNKSTILTPIILTSTLCAPQTILHLLISLPNPMSTSIDLLLLHRGDCPYIVIVHLLARSSATLTLTIFHGYLSSSAKVTPPHFVVFLR